MRRLGPLYGGAVAAVHSTSWRWPEAASDDTRSAFWVVLLGVPVGAVAWMVAALANAAGLPITIAALLGLATLALASAALVERGVVERLDRVGDSRTDTRVASVLVLVFYTLVRGAAILAFAPDYWFGIFVATAVLGRWAAVFLQAIGDPIVDDPSPRSLVTTQPHPLVMVGLSIGVLAIVAAAIGKAGFLAMGITAVLAFVLGVDAQTRDRGLSAPVVAMAAAIGELALLLVATTA